MTPQEAHDLVELMKKAYPNPTISFAGGYCVGGAFCRYLGNPGCVSCFPSHITIAGRIEWCNNRLTEDYSTATMFARQIIQDNDAEQFGRAWDTLETALCYPDQPLLGTQHDTDPAGTAPLASA